MQIWKGGATSPFWCFLQTSNTAQCCHVHLRQYFLLLYLVTVYETWSCCHLGWTGTGPSVSEGELSSPQTTGHHQGSIHQVISTRRGTIHHRVLSCFGDREGVCGCFQPKAVDLAPQTVASSVPQFPEDTSGHGPLCPLDDITEDLRGKWCVVIYENDPYPGIIEDVDAGELFIPHITFLISSINGLTFNS